MIICFMGTPGSGKTYESVKKILDNIRFGRKVYTNIDGFENSKCIEAQKAFLNLSDFDYEVSVHYLTKADVVHFWDIVPPGSLVVIDEAHKYFSNRDWKSEENKGFALWATDHRHLGCDCVLMTHDIEKLDKHVRSCIEWTYEFKKISFLGSFIKKSYLWYAYNSDDVTGKALKWGRRAYDSYIFGCYQSYMAQDIRELGIMTHANILKNPIFYSIPIVVCFAVYMFFQSGFSKGQILGVPVNPVKSARSVLPSSAPNLLPSQHVSGKISPSFPIYPLVPLSSVAVSSSVAPSISPVALPVAAPFSIADMPQPCRTVIAVNSASGDLRVERCGCEEVRYINDKEVSRKMLRPERCVPVVSPRDSSGKISYVKPLPL